MSFQVVAERAEVSPQPLLHAKQPQFPQPLLIRCVLQLPCSCLNMPLNPDVLLGVRVPPLNTVLKVQAHQCHVQGDNHFPSPVGHASSDAGRDDTTTPVITKYIYITATC